MEAMSSAAVRYMEGIVHCPGPDCRYSAWTPLPHEGGVIELWCPVCRTCYCMACQVPAHERQTCQQYQDRSGAEQVEGMLFREEGEVVETQRCPRCGIAMNRTGGCHHMTCRLFTSMMPPIH